MTVALHGAAVAERVSYAAFAVEVFRSARRTPSGRRYGLGALSGLTARMVARALRMVLLSLDERSLRDFGMSRGEVDAAIDDIDHWRSRWAAFTPGNGAR